MAGALLAGRLVLAPIFLIAALAKLADLPGSRRAARDFGVPARLAGVVSVVVPMLEASIAVTLVPRASARWGALVAMVLLIAFAGVIGQATMRGKRPDCHCFGQLHSAPAGPPVLVRNAVLAALAGFVAVAGWHNAGISATHWVTTLTATQGVGLIAGVLLGAGLAFLSWFSVQLLAQNGRLLARVDALEARVGGVAASQSDGSAPDGLPLDSQAPTFSLPMASGATGGLGTLLKRAERVMLVFSDPACGPCTALLPEIADWQGDDHFGVSIALISQGDSAAARARAEEHGLADVFLDEGGSVSRQYGVRATPSAVIVDRRGRIASSLAGGAEAIRGLLREASAAVSVVGQPVPEFTLLDLDGHIRSLAEACGRRTLLLFWNPSCGFCRQMLGELRALEAEWGEEGPGLVMISTGSVEENRALGLRSTVLIDPAFTVGKALAATGTPNAVWLDADGNVASDVAAGIDQVLAIARSDAQSVTSLSLRDGSYA